MIPHGALPEQVRGRIANPRPAATSQRFESSTLRHSQHWCNGSTSVFQTDGRGSSPLCCSILWCRQAVRQQTLTLLCVGSSPATTATAGLCSPAALCCPPFNMAVSRRRPPLRGGDTTTLPKEGPCTRKHTAISAAPNWGKRKVLQPPRLSRLRVRLHGVRWSSPSRVRSVVRSTM